MHAERDQGINSVKNVHFTKHQYKIKKKRKSRYNFSMNYNSKKPDENQVKRYIVERIVGKIFHLVRQAPNLA